MSPQLVRDPPWSEDDLDDLAEGFRYEIVDGRLLVSPRPANPHTRMVMRLVLALSRVLPPGFEAWPEPRLTLPTSSRSPDIIVVCVADVDLRGKRLLPAQVHLAVEVESPSSIDDDRTVKPKEYAEAGIPAYWLVDMDDLITVSLLDPGTTTYRTESGPSPLAQLPYPIDLSGF